VLPAAGLLLVPPQLGTHQQQTTPGTPAAHNAQ
jgi:hypothetical protein